jgi:hypothetical protein
MKTARTEYDENLENRPKREVSLVSNEVGALSFVGSDLDDEDDIKEIEGYSVVNVVEVVGANAAQIERRETRAKWSNPTKILKRKAEGEKCYTSGKTLRTRTWEPTQAVEEEVEMEVETDETIVQTLEKKPCAIRAAPKRKFMDLLKEKANMEELLEEIMDQRVSIRLRDILTSSESLTKLIFKGLPTKEEIAIKVGSAALR